MDNTIRTQADVVRLLGDYADNIESVLSTMLITDSQRAIFTEKLAQIRATKADIKIDLIDNVTVTNLDIALRMCNIQIAPELLDKIIDLVELIEVKGDDVSIKDVLSLQEEWKRSINCKAKSDD